MLDTNIISYIIKNRDFSLIDKFEEMPKEDIISVSSISYALIKTNFESKDLIIAAHAKSLDAVLVTNNTREFERIEDLKIEDWTK